MASTVSWREMVQVNGSFYCNLSTDVEAEDDEECDSGAVTVLQVGTPSTPTSRSASVTAAPEHTIKLVIGAAEPVSLDTSEYVSWDGDNGQWSVHIKLFMPRASLILEAHLVLVFFFLLASVFFFQETYLIDYPILESIIGEKFSDFLLNEEIMRFSWWASIKCI